MKDLDFLPDWYRANQDRRQRRRRHYVIFGVVVAAAVLWSFVVGRSVSGLQAETRQMETAMEQGQQAVQAAYEMDAEIQRLSRQAEVLEALTPRTAVSAVLAELSHCVGDNLVLGRVLLRYEPIAEAKARPDAAGGAIRIGAARSDAPSPLPDVPQRARVVISGVAAGGAQVAGLIEQLENSGYFKTVSPGFSRARMVGNHTVTEFEIACTVADYRIKR